VPSPPDLLCEWLTRHDLSLLAIDADDTLWLDAKYFRSLRTTLIEMGHSQGHTEGEVLERLQRNLHGSELGEAGYALAVRQTAQDMGFPSGPHTTVELAIGAFLNHDIEVLAYAKESLRLLGTCKKVLLTKGVRGEQERKLKESGCGQFFQEVVVLKSKTSETMRKVFDRVRAPQQPLLVIGNSIRHDVMPAVQNGAWAVWMNHSDNVHGRNGILPPQACEVDGWRPIYDCLRGRLAG
jgi:putative hydrolase of the HAD superfamily